MSKKRTKPTAPWGVGGWVALILLTLTIGGFFNLVTLSALGSAGVITYQAARGTVITGTITDAVTHTVRGDKGPDETYCYGYFDSDDGSMTRIRVRVYANGYCFRTEGRPATLVPGAATPLSNVIVEPEADGPGGPMAFNGLFGMTDGAIVDTGPFWRGLWPFIFLAPVAVAIDAGVISLIKEQVKLRRKLRGAGGLRRHR